MIEKYAKELRKKVMDIGYDPKDFAEYYLDTPSGRWEEDGVYNLSLKYSDRVLKIFTDQVEEHLKENGHNIE